MSNTPIVTVAPRFQRSIQIDVDLGDADALEGFICPASSSELIRQLCGAWTKDHQAAFTWTGPYGTGKSSLALAFAHAIHGSAPDRRRARKAFGNATAQALALAFPVANPGWAIVPVVGRRAPLATLLGDALQAAGLVRGRSKDIWSDDTVYDAIEKIASRRERLKSGLLLLLDELGKTLEGAARSGADLFLLQRLAELASRRPGLLVVGILHQAFDEYAHNLAWDQRAEWVKIQGRFLDLVLASGVDEQLTLFSRAITARNRPAGAERTAKTFVRALGGRRPSPNYDLAGILEQCWPLHPAVALLLGPISRRRFSQNQRSLFGFLTSSEPLGFQDFLRNRPPHGQFNLDALWEYLRANLEPAILASPDGHKWALAVDTIERCEARDASAVHRSLLRAIALIDLFKERSGIDASADILSVCVEGPPAAVITKALADLVEWSLVIFRKHMGAYALFAGSDFDIQAALASAHNAVEDTALIELRRMAGFQPVLAKRHYHATGALRWLTTDLTAVENLPQYVASGPRSAPAMGDLLLLIPTKGESAATQQDICQAALRMADDPALVVGISASTTQLIAIAKDYVALTRILEREPQLRGDRVARREVIARQAHARAKLDSELQQTLEAATWYQRGNRLEAVGLRALSEVASVIADGLYNSTPRVPNELLNRDQLSSNAVAAVKGLLKRLTTHLDQPRLGYEGYPAEAGLFESIVSRGLLVRRTGELQSIQIPDVAHDPLSLRPVLSAGRERLRTADGDLVSIHDLYELWRKPPFGVKQGLLPLLAVILMLAERDSIGVYREGLFQQSLTDLDIDYMFADPKTLRLRYLVLDETTKATLEQLEHVIRPYASGCTDGASDALSVARQLVQVYEGLVPWTKRTSRVSPTASRVRHILKTASDPNKLLFHDLPALSRGEVTLEADPASGVDIARLLGEAVEELSEAYSKLLRSLGDLMLKELGVDMKRAGGPTTLRARASNILELTGDLRLKAFIGRLARYDNAISDIEGICSLAIGKPMRELTDTDIATAQVEIARLSSQFRELEPFAYLSGHTPLIGTMSICVVEPGRPYPMTGQFSLIPPDSEHVAQVRAALQGTLSHFGPELVPSQIRAIAGILEELILQEQDRNPSKRAVI